MREGMPYGSALVTGRSAVGARGRTTSGQTTLRPKQDARGSVRGSVSIRLGQTLQQAGQLLWQVGLTLGADAKGKFIGHSTYLLGKPARTGTTRGLSRVTKPQEQALAGYGPKDSDIAESSFLLRLIVDEEFCIVDSLCKRGRC